MSGLLRLPERATWLAASVRDARAFDTVDDALAAVAEPAAAHSPSEPAAAVNMSLSPMPEGVA
jgi:hypothetical protein